MKKRGQISTQEILVLVDIKNLINEISEIVGAQRVKNILESYKERISGHTSKQLEKFVDKLIVVTEDEVDGG